MKFRRTKDKHIAAIDIAPLVDVVFLLLIFFMLSFGSPINLSSVDLPESKSGSELSKQALTVAISEKEILIDGKPSDKQGLLSLPKGADIIVEAKRDIPYFKVIEVLDILRTSGHNKISLATKAVKDSE
ncbi:MAG: biopolymer transporter ExbD [Thermodesulfobacteriota bacterium]|nr:biopolymer transporter ExbD [Thermodesulfobacteriota bacterium]